MHITYTTREQEFEATKQNFIERFFWIIFSLIGTAFYLLYRIRDNKSNLQNLQLDLIT